MDGTSISMILFLLLTSTAPGIIYGGIMEYKYDPPFPCNLESSLNENLYKSMNSYWLLDCIRKCSHDLNCSYVTYNATMGICFLFSEIICNESTGNNVMMFKKTKVCLNNGEYDEAIGSCRCFNGYVGNKCERLMIDCTEGYKSGHYNNDLFGLYLIQPSLAPAPIQVECDMGRYGGGTFIMKNTIWAVNLSRNLNWHDYKIGFGVPLNNLWVGLQNIYYISSSRPQHLFMNVFDEWDGKWRKYENFRVEDESGNYRMTYSGSSPWSQNDVDADPDWNEPIANTPLGDSMVGLNGSAFSTYDRDNDQDTGRNCAQDYQGGWWFNACADCNPNGPVTSPPIPNTVQASWATNNGSFIPHIEAILRAA